MNNGGVDFNPDQYEPVEDSGGVDFDPQQYEPVEDIPEAPGETPDDLLEQSMAVASQKNPDQSAEYLKLAQQYNVSPQFAEQNYDMLKQKKEAAAINPQKTIAATPALAKFLANPENAMVARDDVDALGRIEDAQKSHGFGGQLFDAFRSGIYATGSSLAKIPALMHGDAPGNMALYGSEYEIAEYKREAGPVPKELYDNKTTQYLDAKAKQYAPEEQAKSIVTEGLNGNYANAGKAFAFQIAANLPLLGVMAVSRGAGLPLMFASSSAEKFADNLEKGIPQDLAKSNALVTGSIETGVESMFGVGSSGFKESIKAVVKGLGKEGAKEVFQNGVKQVLKSAGEEGAEEFVTSFSQDLVDFGSGVNDKALEGIMTRATDSFIVGAGAGGVVSGSSISVETGYKMFQQSAEAQNTKGAYNQIGAAAKESKLNGRLPEKLKEFVGQVTDGTAIQDVFIPVEAFETYFQSKKISPVQAAQQLGLSGKYEAAKESGSDLKMPMADWVSNTVNTEHYDGLANDVKFSPDQLSVNQAKAEQVALKADLEVQAKVAQETKAPEPDPNVIDFEAKGKEIGSQIVEQLKATGMKEKDARAYSKIYESTFKTLGKRLSQDPKALFENYGLRISGEQGKGGTVFNQEYQMPRKGIKLAVTTIRNSLSLNPLEGVEASGSIINGGEAVGKTFMISKLKTTEKYLGVAQDMISSLEREASIKGAQTVLTSTKRLGIDINSPMGDLFKQAGYTVTEKDGDVILTKKIQVPKTYNQDVKKLSKKDLMKNKKALEKEGFKFYESEDPYFDDNGNEIEGPALGEEGSSFSIYVEDKTGNEIGSAKFKVENGKLVANDYDGQFPAVNVDASFQRKGIATEMYRMASELAGKPVADLNSKTKEGKEFRDAIRDGKNFLQGGETPRGQIRFGTGSINIELLKNADPSTFIHETGHFYLEVFGDIASKSDTPQEVKDDFKKILTWLGVESKDQIGVEQHEQFARGFEAYLMEGKAPDQALRKVFIKFKTWLTSVYRELVNLDVQLTDEVRMVFDRLLVSQEAINNAQAEQGFDKHFFSALRDSGMNNEQILKYQEATAEAGQAAEDQIRKKLMEDVTKRDTAFYKEQKQKIKDQVTEELASSLKYNALYVLQKGTTVDGQALPEGLAGLKLSKSSLDDKLTEGQKKTLPKGISSPDGIHLEIAAEFLGFRDGHQLIAALSDIPSLSDAIANETEVRMSEAYPDYMGTPQLSEDTVMAIHNDKREAVLRMELQYLMENKPSVVKDVIRRIAKRIPPKKEVQEQARRIVGALTVKDISPSVYRRAEQRLRKEAGVLAAKGDFDAAFEAKRKELLNFELYRAAQEAKDEIKKARAEFKKIGRSDEDISKSRDTDLVNAARAILAQYGIGKADKAPEEYLSKIQKYDPDRYAELVAIINPIYTRGAPFESVDFDTFVDMRETVKALWDLSKSEKEFDTGEQKLQIDNVMTELNTRLGELSKGGGPSQFEGSQTTGEAIKTGFLSFKAALTRVEHWANTVGGRFTEYLWRPVSDARNRYKIEKEKVSRQYLEISKILDKQSLNRGPIAAPEISKTAYGFKDKKELLGAILHTGNESNMKKLLIGRGWGSVNEDGSIDTGNWNKFISRMQAEGILTKADYDWAQAVWNLNDSLKPDAQKAHKKLYGFYFNEITAKSFQTPFGEYQGGYVPAVADPEKSEAGAIRNEKEAMERGQNSFMFPSTGRGFTKGRVENYATQLSLNLDLVGSHIDKVLRFTYIEPAIKQAARIVMNDNFRAELALYDPEAGSGMLVPWLQRSASQKKSNPSGNGKAWRIADAFFSTLRVRTGMNIMAGNTINVLQNYTGIIVAAAKVKPKYIRNATWNYITNSKELAKIASEKSDFMKTNLTNQIADVQNDIKKIYRPDSALTTIKEFAQENAYILQIMSQNQNNTIIWHAAYNESIEKGRLEKEAVQEADAAVRLTQGSLEATDASRFETGSPFLQMFTQFYSYFNNLANLQASEVQKISREIGLKKGAGRLFFLFMTTLYLPSVMSEVLRRIMSGLPPDADDDDEYLDDAMAVFLGAPASFFAAEVPFVGALANTLSNTFNDKHYDDKLNVSPAISTLENMVKLPKEIYEAIGEDSNNKKQNRAIRDTLTFIGLLSGVPTGALSRPLTYLNDVQSGEVESEGPVDFTRGLITGKSGQ